MLMAYTKSMLFMLIYNEFVYMGDWFVFSSLQEGFVSTAQLSRTDKIQMRSKTVVFVHVSTFPIKWKTKADYEWTLEKSNLLYVQKIFYDYFSTTVSSASIAHSPYN